jgi:hypothetical protein
MMIYLINKAIDPDTMPVLYERPLSAESIASDFAVFGGEWKFEEGWLTGRNSGNFAGMIISRADFFGDVMLDFTARTLLPASHDINIMWNGSWDEKTKARGPGYVIGIQGWWYGKVGFEKQPDYKLMAATPLFSFEPGRAYHIQAGSVNGHVFILADGKLLMELLDPDPIDNQKYGKIGFEAYCTQVQIRDIKVRQALWQPHETAYTPEF